MSEEARARAAVPNVFAAFNVIEFHLHTLPPDARLEAKAALSEIDAALVVAERELDNERAKAAIEQGIAHRAERERDERVAACNKEIARLQLARARAKRERDEVLAALEGERAHFEAELVAAKEAMRLALDEIQEDVDIVRWHQRHGADGSDCVICVLSAALSAGGK